MKTPSISEKRVVFGSTEVCSSFRNRTRFPLQFFSGACAGKKISTAIGAKTPGSSFARKALVRNKKNCSTQSQRFLCTGLNTP